MNFVSSPSADPHSHFFESIEHPWISTPVVYLHKKDSVLKESLIVFFLKLERKKKTVDGNLCNFFFSLRYPILCCPDSSIFPKEINIP